MSSNTQYVPVVDLFECTDEFRGPAIFFSTKDEKGRDRGFYTNLIKGTEEYKQFWEEEDYKCRYGMTNSKGIRITGPHYFYLNYVQIKLKDPITGRKKYGFPRFLDIDYDFFHLIEVARKAKKGLIFSKPRRGGFSFKDAALVTHEYNFYRDSTCVVGAYLGDLATNTMNMVLHNMNFLNANTEWRKQRNPDTKEFVKARYEANIDGIKVWKGYMSEVQKVSFKDNPFASIGKSASIFIFEEAGKFFNLKESYNLTEPCWKDGDDMIGIPIIYGTGGDMEGGTADFAHMFYNPKSYNLLEFDNIWEPTKAGTKCGWFIPATRGRLGEDLASGIEMVDSEGNSNEKAAYDSIMRLRETKRKSNDRKSIQDAITQYPLTPSESFLRNTGAIFSGPEMQEWLGRLETTPSLNDKKKVILYFDENNKIKAQLAPDLYDITNYPLDKEESKQGCIVIWEDPIKDAPFGLYIAGIDPYDHDKAENSDSLGSCFIYKRIYSLDSTHDIPVAEYTGRPDLAQDFYENCRRLCIYYNAKCLYENQLKGLKVYFEQKNSLHYLYEQPGILKDIVKNTTVNRGYGIHMTQGIKDQCEIWLKNWLYTERSNEDGTKILNLHTIKSIGLLKELIAYDGEINTDRVVAFMCCIAQLQEMHNIHVNQHKLINLLDTDPFWRRPLFQKNTYNKIKY